MSLTTERRELSAVRNDRPETERSIEPWPRRHSGGSTPGPRRSSTSGALDPHWAAIIDAVGPCRLEPRPDRFGTLVRAIIGQQISSKAAASIDARLRDLAGEPHQPEPLARARRGRASRSAGLSGVKARYVLNLAEAVHGGSVPLDEVHAWDDEAIIAALTAVKGIGAWTAEMFLIFALEPARRPPRRRPGHPGRPPRPSTAWPNSPKPRECRELAEALAALPDDRHVVSLAGVDDRRADAAAEPVPDHVPP